MYHLSEKLCSQNTVPVLFSLTPPHLGILPDKLVAMNERRTRRLKGLGLDGLCIYDVQDESARNPEKRLYEFSEFMDSFSYADSLKSFCKLETITYCAISKYERYSFIKRLKNEAPQALVLVGKTSRYCQSGVDMAEAFALCRDLVPELCIGAICIPERHAGGRRETERLLHKYRLGARFFVTQCIYDISLLQGMLTDYASTFNKLRKSTPRIIFTLSPVSSQANLDFFRWLGISVPERVEQRLVQAENMLDESLCFLKETADRIARQCRQLEIPLGFNIESVISKKEEVLAAADLAKRIKEAYCPAAITA